MPDKEKAREIRAEWVRRLRSDEFYQIQSRLRDDGRGRCCLGVYCDVLIDGGYVKATRWVGRELYTPDVVIKEFLPTQEMWGLSGLSMDFQTNCTTWNDMHNCDFNFIADRIEEEDKNLSWL